MNDIQQENFNQALGKRLMLLRQSKHMSQEQLGSHIGVRGQQIYKYETCENRITPERLLICAKILGVSVGYFYGEEEENAPLYNNKAVMNVANEIIALPKEIHQGIYMLSRIINKHEAEEAEKKNRAA